MVISSEEFREYCEKYGLQNEAGYDDLDQLYAENSDKGSNDKTASEGKGADIEHIQKKRSQAMQTGLFLWQTNSPLLSVYCLHGHV